MALHTRQRTVGSLLGSPGVSRLVTRLIIPNSDSSNRSLATRVLVGKLRGKDAEKARRIRGKVKHTRPMSLMWPW